MRKNVFGRQFKRDRNERKALFKGLISSLIKVGRIRTTEEKAKAIKSDVDKIITHAKEGEIARRILQAELLHDAVDKVISDIAPRFSKRQGGYTRIIKIGKRLSDNASMALMEFVEGNEVQILDKKDEGKIKVKQTRKPKIVGKKETKAL